MTVEEAASRALEQYEGWWWEVWGCNKSGVRGKAHPFLGWGRLLRVWF